MKDYLLYSRISKQNLPDAWIHAMPWIQKSLGEVNSYHHELAEIGAQLKGGYMTLWSIQDKREGNKPICFLVTHTISCGGFRTFVIRWCGGSKIDEWLEDIKELEHLAEVDNCHKVEVWGRPGWIKRLHRFGYRPEFYVISKVLVKKVQ